MLARDVTERSELFTRMAVADRMLSVGTLAAGVAHEINNPLAFVVSNLALLADELPRLFAGEPIRLDRTSVEELLVDAREGAARVSAIVRDMRALARPDDVTTSVDVAKVLASSIRMAANELRHRARVVVHIDAAPSVRANASRLGQVFLNLLVNAAQAIPEGRAEINEVRVRLSASAGSRHAIIEIEDTGIGIPSHRDRPDPRSVLHDQADRRWRRARSGDHAPDRDIARRRDRGDEHARAGRALPDRDPRGERHPRRCGRCRAARDAGADGDPRADDSTTRSRSADRRVPCSHPSTTSRR